MSSPFEFAGLSSPVRTPYGGDELANWTKLASLRCLPNYDGELAGSAPSAGYGVRHAVSLPVNFSLPKCSQKAPKNRHAGELNFSPAILMKPDFSEAPMRVNLRKLAQYAEANLEAAMITTERPAMQIATADSRMRHKW